MIMTMCYCCSSLSVKFNSIQEQAKLLCSSTTRTHLWMNGEDANSSDKLYNLL
uniref:Uncharacterized protein n=1 Tax=Anguilla anguilla TaxID=7936 RepID=A0A0E9QWB2_ANGAN